MLGLLVAQAFSSCCEQGLPFVVVHGLLIAVTSVVEDRLWALGLSSCGTRAYLPRGTWDLPGPESEPMSPALVGGFLTTGLRGKVLNKNFKLQTRTKKRFSLLAEGSYKGVMQTKEADYSDFARCARDRMEAEGTGSGNNLCIK